MYLKILDSAQPHIPRHQPREVLNVEVWSSNANKKSILEVNLKPVPSLVGYEFLDLNSAFPIIISTKIDGTQIEKLLKVLKRHKGAIGYNIDGLKALSPSLCIYRIFVDEGLDPPDNLNTV